MAERTDETPEATDLDLQYLTGHDQLRQAENTGGEGYEVAPLDPIYSDSGSSTTTSSDDDEMELNHRELQKLIMDERVKADFVPIIITVAGVPYSGKCASLHDLFEKYDLMQSQTKTPPIPHCSFPGISMYELAACHNDQNVVQYVPTDDDTCYLNAVYSVLLCRYRIRNQKIRLRNESSPDRPRRFFADESLDASLKKLFDGLQKIQTSGKPNKFFKRFLPTGVAFINMWNIGLSKAVFYFLPCLIGQFTNSYLWLFFDLERDVENFHLPPDIPNNDHHLMLWRSRLYYLLQYVYFTTGLVAQSSIHCSVFPSTPSSKTIDEVKSGQLIDACKKEMMALAKEMKLVGSISQCEFNLVSGKKSVDSIRCKLLKCKADQIVNEGFKFPQKIKLSWIFLRNVFYETNTLYVEVEDLKQKAKALKIEDLDKFCLFFSSFASIIDASQIGPQSPYIITKPTMFFSKLDELFYYDGDEYLCKYGLLTLHLAEQIFGKSDVKFFTDVLISAKLALELKQHQFLFGDKDENIFKDALYYIPVASQLSCTTSCELSALHLQITGPDLCGKLQIIFLEQFLKCYSSAKIHFSHQSNWFNCTSLVYNDLDLKLICHGNEVEFILCDEEHSEERLFQAVLDSCYAILCDKIKTEALFKFNFSFMCYQKSLTTNYELNREKHWLPLNVENLCEKCKSVYGHSRVLKKWNSLLKEEKRWRDLPQMEAYHLPTAPISLSCLQLIAESLNELSVSALDSFARLLKFEDGLENLALKGFKGWKLVTVMILEWERSSSIEEQKTLLFLKQKLSVLRDDSTGNDQDIVKVALEKLHIHFQA